MQYTTLESLIDELATPLVGEKLFAQVPDILFCIKNREGVYLTANRAFADKLNLRSAKEIVGRTAADLFPAYLAQIYQEQDASIFSTGEEIVDRLELVTGKRGKLGWHLASKFPLYAKSGEIIAVASISRDLQMPCDDDLQFAGIGSIVEFIQKEYAGDIDTSHLAKTAGLTIKQLDARMRRIFKLTTSQFIRKTRIAAASNALTHTKKSIATVAQESGYGDQSAFTRQFRAIVGMTPGAYRKRHGV